MNEILFLTHIFVVSTFLYLSSKLGKEGLFIFVVLSGVLANLFVIKQIELVGLSVTCGDAFAVGSILGVSFIHKLFGYEEAKKVSNYSFLALIFWAVMVFIVLQYKPNSFDFSQNSFKTIFGFTWRIIGSSIFSFWLSQRIVAKLMSLLKGSFIFRSITSVVIASMIDTSLFAVLALWGIVGSIWQVVLFSYLVKISTTIGCSLLLGAFNREV